ncbi:carcinoembryonic antigen-related cell adhesion molecule 1 [Elysia marginata]|uniref:Carcinoembryonic antigen-related cell adhesion molecule 1 n=1 Tax=Elysia marginata TaxID=1093978 RepID=A0AAV4G2B7_9GAST|nr:carcinoembryonic antigen-related cell adhesion molecule 1 [Elysia marginata]
MFLNAEDELTRVTWYHLAPPISTTPLEIFTLDPTREHPSYFFSAKWAGRGILQPMGDAASSVTIVLPARYVTRKDAGRYRCQMQSLMSGGFGDVQVTVHYGPGTSLMVSPSGRVQKEEGAELTLSCSAICDPHCNYKWYKAGRTISNSPAVHVMSLSRDDAGLYACQAANSAGSSVKPVDVRVRFAAHVTALSLTTRRNDATGSAINKHKTPEIFQDLSNSTDKVPLTISKNHFGNSLRQFTVTLVCNVSGWPEPMIKWGIHQEPFESVPNSFRSNTPRFRSIDHRWSFTEKSGIAVLTDATCLDNGNYSCFTYNNDSPSLKTLPVTFSKQTARLDLPCPPVVIRDPSILPSSFSGDAPTQIKANSGLTGFVKEKINKDLCESNPAPIEIDGDTEVIVAKFNATIFIQICFVSNPKPALKFWRLPSENANNVPADRRDLFKVNLIDHGTFKEPVPTSPKAFRNDRVSIPNSLFNKTSKSINVSHVAETDYYISYDNAKLNELKQDDYLLKDEANSEGVEFLRERLNITLKDKHYVMETPVNCLNSTHSGLCVVKINFTVTSPIQYGCYELTAKNTHGEARKKYCVVSRQAPLPPNSFRLDNVSWASACFSWEASFDGGATQTFHLCYKKLFDVLNNSTNSRTVEDQNETENVCVTVPSGDNSDSSNKGEKAYWSDFDMRRYSHCFSTLTLSSRYEATIFSSNQYGKSKLSNKISFITKLRNIWITPKSVLSFLSSALPLDSKEHLSPTGETTTQIAHPETYTEVTTQSDVWKTKRRPSEPRPSTFSTRDAVNDGLEPGHTHQHQEVYHPNRSDDDTNWEHEEIKDNQRAHDDEDDFLEELLFDEDDFIYGKINDIRFFQLFDVHHLMRSGYDDEDFHRSSDDIVLTSANDSLSKDQQAHQNKQKLPPLHLQKLILRYSRPHAKIRAIKTEIGLQNLSFDTFSTPWPSLKNLDFLTTTISHVYRDKDLTLPPLVKKYKLLAIIGAAGTAVTVLGVVLSLFFLRVWRRHRRLERLKQRYQQRIMEQASGRGRYPAVEIEDANSARNRLSSLRDRNTSTGFNLQAFPMLLPSHDVRQLAQVPTHQSQRQSITCISNENAFYSSPSPSFQVPMPRRQKEDTNLSQRQLRPTSSTPAIDKGINQLTKVKGEGRTSASFSASSSPIRTKSHNNVPTITIAEDCGFSVKHPRLSFFPSYLDLQSNDHDHLRPPSHHSSYSSVRQGSPLLRLDSSSSGATANYFNLYEGLASKSSRSRSPSNVYDPLTFEAGPRSNPPSRRDSCVVKARHGAAENDINKPVYAADNYKALSVKSTAEDVNFVSNKTNRTSFHRPPSPQIDDISESGVDTGSRISRGMEPKATPEHQTRSLIDQPSTVSNYERIFRQSPVFSSERKMRKPRTSFEMKNLFSLSLPRNTQKTSRSNPSWSSITRFELNPSRKKENASPCPQQLSDHRSAELTKQVNQEISTRNLSRVPLPPVSNLDREEGLDEPIYADIDDNIDNNNSACHANRDGNSFNNNNINNSTNTKTNSIMNNDTSSDFALRPPIHLSRHLPIPSRFDPPTPQTYESFVSLGAISSEHLTQKLRLSESKVPPACAPSGHQRLPDIMLCADKGYLTLGSSQTFCTTPLAVVFIVNKTPQDSSDFFTQMNFLRGVAERLSQPNTSISLFVFDQVLDGEFVFWWSFQSVRKEDFSQKMLYARANKTLRVKEAAQFFHSPDTARSLIISLDVRLPVMFYLSEYRNTNIKHVELEKNFHRVYIIFTNGPHNLKIQRQFKKQTRAKSIYMSEINTVRLKSSKIFEYRSDTIYKDICRRTTLKELLDRSKAPQFAPYFYRPNLFFEPKPIFKFTKDTTNKDHTCKVLIQNNNFRMTLVSKCDDDFWSINIKPMKNSIMKAQRTCSKYGMSLLTLRSPEETNDVDRD